MPGVSRDRLFLMASLVMLWVGGAVWVTGRPQTGLSFALADHGRIVVAAVEPGSIGWINGAARGMVVAGSGPGGPVLDDVIGRSVDLADQATGATVHVNPDSSTHSLVLLALWIGIVQLAAAATLARRSRDGSTYPSIGGPVVLASITPIALVPLAAFGSSLTLALGAVLWPLSVAPLAWSIAGRVSPPSLRAWARVVAGVGLIGAVALAPLLFVVPGPATSVVLLREVLVAIALLGPVVLVTSSAAAGTGAWVSLDRPLAWTLGLVAAALAPLGVRLVTTVALDGSAALIILLGLAAGLFLARFGIAPFVSLATRVARQRDLVAGTAETERRRMAADLHDGPLQSLTLLAYRLEADGSMENADFARDIVTELRAITSTLRLPIVDDLGAGPALEWMAQRFGRLTGTEIELDRADQSRPPRDIEHVVVRVAQEALANATRHGRPPIRVRYEADGARARLVVDDAGDGLSEAGRSNTPEGGHGLVGMRERADAIGATLEVASRGGGTRVSLVWPAGGA